MPCLVPEQLKHYRYHYILNMFGRIELAEWVNDDRNGPSELGHWVRWGCCGDFPSLCQAEYIGPH